MVHMNYGAGHGLLGGVPTTLYGIDRLIAVCLDRFRDFCPVSVTGVDAFAIGSDGVGDHLPSIGE